MATRESNILKKIHKATSKMGARFLRNNTGLFLTLDGKRIAHAGLGKGTSDLIGWMPVKITPEMVGRTVAVFSAIEVKKPGGKRLSNQADFINVVAAMGGIAGFATSEDEAAEIIDRYLKVK